MRGLYLRGGRDQGDTGYGLCPQTPASSAVRDGKKFVARVLALKKVIAMDWEKLIPGHPGPGGRQTCCTVGFPMCDGTWIVIRRILL